MFLGIHNSKVGTIQRTNLRSLGSLGTLQKKSFDIEIFCAYEVYYLLLRVQNKILLFRVKRTSSPKSNIFTHFKQGRKKNIIFNIKPIEIHNLHSLFC